MRAERIAQLKNDIKNLKKQIEEEKAKKGDKKGEAIVISQTISANSTVTLDAEKSCYMITIEIPTPIDSIILRSEMNVLYKLYYSLIY